MTSIRVPGFSPQAHGFHFRNAFHSNPIRQFRLGTIATLNIGDAANGLCGGMSFAVRDMFERGIGPPPDTSAPGSGDPRYDYIVERQIDSFDNGLVPLAFYLLMDPRLPEREPFWAPWLSYVRIDRHSRTYSMIHDQWPRVRADLEAGKLSMLGLVKVVDRDPMKLGHNHQVVAYGYDLVGTALTLHIYDPNYPNDDTVALSVDVRDPRGVAVPTYSKAAGPVFCFFHIPYSPREPTPFK
jgi:hypothetical protein